PTRRSDPRAPGRRAPPPRWKAHRTRASSPARAWTVRSVPSPSLDDARDREAGPNLLRGIAQRLLGRKGRAHLVRPPGGHLSSRMRGGLHGGGIDLRELGHRVEDGAELGTHQRLLLRGEREPGQAGYVAYLFQGERHGQSFLKMLSRAFT